MSPNCGICELPCVNDESDPSVKCSGACAKSFHSNCVKSDKEGTKTRSLRDWKCKECRDPSSVNSSVGSATVPLTKDFFMRVLDNLKTDVFGELKSFRTELAELNASAKFISDKLDESSQLWKEVTQELTVIKKENYELQLKNANLSSEVGVLKDKVRSLEQYSRVNNIEISGLPVTAGENVVDLVKDVGTAIGVAVKNGDISATHRVPSFKKERTPSIIVQFLSRSTREAWLRGFREKKEVLAHQVNPAFPKQKFYINEHLSPDNKVFLAKLKEKCKEVKYDYAWCRDGKFFVRKAQGEKYKRIDTYEDLNKLK